jgi:hypothetical protein
MCRPQSEKHLPGHDVWTAPQMGRRGKKDGELLNLMTANGFEVLLTDDQNNNINRIWQRPT